MIARIEGRLVSRDDQRVVVLVGGIGFELLVPLRVAETLPPTGELVALETYLHVRQDTLQLYGFADAAERGLFLTLLSVGNVGPALALAVLSNMPVETFCHAIIAGDERTLRLIPGVGPKVAKRLVFELAERVRKLESSGVVKAAGAGGQLGADAVAALVTLGCALPVAERAVRAALEETPGIQDTAQLVREALKRRSAAAQGVKTG